MRIKLMPAFRWWSEDRAKNYRTTTLTTACALSLVVFTASDAIASRGPALERDFATTANSVLTDRWQSFARDHATSFLRTWREHVEPPAQFLDGRRELPSVIQASSQVLPPLAHAKFCVNHPDQCAHKRSVLHEGLTHKDMLSELQRVNLRVNRAIKPLDDIASIGLADQWNVNVTQGDCEDYALEKRKRLLNMGWSSSQLRIATVLTADNNGHALLIARVDGQDYALDSLAGAVRPWNETNYHFVKIQSEDNPKTWFSVDNTPTQFASVS